MREMALMLVGSERGIVFLGQLAMSHPQASSLRQLAKWISTAAGCRINLLPHGGNPVGAWRAGAVPHRGPGGKAEEPGMNVREMLESPRMGYLLWGFEPDFDVSNPALTELALSSADKVLAIASFATGHLADLADVILPLAPLAESEGMMYRLDGGSAQLRPAGRISGQCKPGWKILRRLGEELGLEGFGQVSLLELQTEMEAGLSGEAATGDAPELAAESSAKGLYRFGEIPMYGIDPLCRRSDALQQTVHAQSGFVGLNPADAAALKLKDGTSACVDQGGEKVELTVRISGDVPEDAAWVRSATCATRTLGDSFGPVTVKAAGEKS